MWWVVVLLWEHVGYYCQLVISTAQWSIIHHAFHTLVTYRLISNITGLYSIFLLQCFNPCFILVCKVLQVQKCTKSWNSSKLVNNKLKYKQIKARQTRLLSRSKLHRLLHKGALDIILQCAVWDSLSVWGVLKTMVSKLQVRPIIQVAIGLMRWKTYQVVMPSVQST